MTDQLVSQIIYSLAVFKGFDIKAACICGGYPDCICDPNRIIVPTQSLLQKWLRSKNVEIVIEPSLYRSKDKDPKLVYSHQTFSSDFDSEVSIYEDLYDTYEEALEVALYEGLKLIK